MTQTERDYYDRRAPEYDDWYLGTGLFEQRVRPGWTEELAALKAALAALSFGTVLDVACGTGFLTASLGGNVIGLAKECRAAHLFGATRCSFLSDRSTSIA
jgi:SAM-dependent methyltransferase